MEYAQGEHSFAGGRRPRSKVGRITHYGTEGQEITGKEPGTVMTVAFDFDGRPFTALNGGADFRFNEAISFEVFCETQQDIDFFWDSLGPAGGGVESQCGWLKDRYGVSWQIVPTMLDELLGDQTSVGSKRAMRAMLKMVKLDIEALQRAYTGR